VVEAVVFDVDGVLVQSEELWDRARRELAADAGIAWPDGATEAMMGMSSPEWSRYVAEEVGVPLAPQAINAAVLARVEGWYRERLPWIGGAREALLRIAERWPVALATSSNREIVDLVIGEGGLGDAVRVSVSSEEVAAGKPAPDVYLEAVRRLGADPRRSVAIEDSTNGLLSAAAAGLGVIAIPNPAHPPAERGLAVASVILDGIGDLTPSVVANSFD
jgi:HAD superfamily hydrolase (TIGR01509 family)